MITIVLMAAGAWLALIALVAAVLYMTGPEPEADPALVELAEEFAGFERTLQEVRALPETTGSASWR